jgi:DHA2 family multidrug resistance protein
MILRGAAMGFLWIPLTLATLSGLHGKEMADGTGLFNLSRQLGGSAGIAYLTTFVAHRTDIHFATLTEHVRLSSPATITRLQTLVQGFMAEGSPMSVARKRALTVVSGTIQGQAALMAFEDAFIVIAIVLVVSLPLLLLFKKGVPQAHASRMEAE